ncbi:hypothetical protein GOP47_0002707 [Adiantum capillus-veneris]|nr:hypothetical protein GOP47_0002707 [Adiantum capillus-veneris]
MLFILAYQSFGVVYGDLSTSPLYVFKSAFVRKLHYHESEVAVYGVLSFIFWTLTLIPVLKYIVIVLSADDNGEGGPFALYSLLCRHAKVGLFPAQQSIDEELSTYTLHECDPHQQNSRLKALFERHQNARIGLLILVLLGTCMVIGNGVLTPAISVLSSVQGLQVVFLNLHSYVALLLACIILVGLFTLQYFGTHRVAFLFAPVILAWLFCMAVVGLYNIIYWNPKILQALSPYYLYQFFQVAGREGWVSLGGVLLCITGTEAMFADLGHFTQSSIRVAFMFVVYPCLVLAYVGHAAFLSRNLSHVEGSFYQSVPSPVYWPVFVVGTFASIVGSQAVISATFSMIKHCQALNCFPRVKIVHTSKQIMGQIYIPEINWILMVLCLTVTLGFQDTTAIGNAYGFAAIIVMFVTTCLMTLVIVIVWQRSILIGACFLIVFGAMEGLYFSATIMKVPEGGWVPIVLAMLFMSIMYTWHYGTAKKYEFDLQNKVSMKWILTLGPSLGIVRVPGIGLIYTELVTGVPAIFSHFVTNLPAFHQILVFVCIKSVHVPFVPVPERYLVGRVGPKEYRMYRCIVRYGYKDIHKEDDDFENNLIIRISEYIQREAEENSSQPSWDTSLDGGQLTVVGTPGHAGMQLVLPTDDGDVFQAVSLSSSKSATLQSFQSVSELESPQLRRRRVRFELPKNPNIAPSVRDEMIELIEAKQAGVAYVLGHSYVRAKKTSPYLKRLAIDVGYSFLRKNCRGPAVALNIPHICLIEVGMIYYI